MTERVRNILLGAGSVISVNGAATIRSSRAVHKISVPSSEGLDGDFRQIGNDLVKSLNTFGSKKIMHG